MTQVRFLTRESFAEPAPLISAQCIRLSALYVLPLKTTFYQINIFCQSIIIFCGFVSATNADSKTAGSIYAERDRYQYVLLSGYMHMQLKHTVSDQNS